jgi:hypothetical protein
VSKLTIDQRFEIFHNNNPEILDALIRLALDAQARGYETYSIKGLWEVLRYQADPITAERYKLSNDFTSRYSRLVMRSNSNLAGFFRTKILKTQTPNEDDDLTQFIDPAIFAA